MTTVFISGSRAVSRLNGTIRAKLNDLIDRQCMIFVGDANGADKAVQQHFASRGYRHVLVYCMDRCRNNLGKWPAKHVAASSGKVDFAYYASKDLAMARDAKCGIMLWDGKSKGTLNNIQQVVNAGKQALVYLAPRKTFFKLTDVQDLRNLLQRCDADAIQHAQRQIRTRLTSADQLPLPSPRV